MRVYRSWRMRLYVIWVFLQTVHRVPSISFFTRWHWWHIGSTPTNQHKTGSRSPKKILNTKKKGEKQAHFETPCLTARVITRCTKSHNTILSSLQYLDRSVARVLLRVTTTESRCVRNNYLAFMVTTRPFIDFLLTESDGQIDRSFLVSVAIS